MIKISDKHECCGCNACGDICPKQCITFTTDIEGFWYPVVDESRCIDCHLCEKVCPELQIDTLKKNDYDRPAKTIAAINKRMDVRWKSSSGGAYTILAEEMLSQGGWVSGAVYGDGFTVHNFITDNADDLERLRGSKYVHSNAEGLYARIKELLVKGEKVLACGTPCQMAALRSYLRKDYENLTVVDFICRGVNSPKAYRKYLDSLERRFGGKVVAVTAKDKEEGWRSPIRRVRFDNGSVYSGHMGVDGFGRGYFANVLSRPSCYSCKFKGFPRMSDITIADFWGIEKVDRNLDNNAGTSLILLNSKKGVAYFEGVKDKFEWREVPLESALPDNGALLLPLSPARVDRDAFYQELDKVDFNELADKYFPIRKNSQKEGLKNKLKGVARAAKNLWDKFGLSPKSWINFVKINYRKNTQRSEGNMLFTMPGAVFDIHPSARIVIDGTMLYGSIPVKGMRVPTCLRMTAGTSLTIHGHSVNGIGQNPLYRMNYGAYIEVVNGGSLTIGRGFCNVGLTLMCAKEVTIGDDVHIGRDVSIRDWNGEHVIVNDTYVNHAPVHIGNHVWLCSGCSIMPGVTVGEGSVVAANSTVTKDVPPYSMVAGSPARVVKTDVRWYK